MERTITKIDAIQKLEVKIRVAAYARVSSGKDSMLHSLAQQVNYYKNLIQSSDKWTFAGVYADEAYTGTKDTRHEFQALLKDAKAGKIDMILTKSISRFARNTVTLLETVRALKAINVDVFFEEQNIHTLSSEGEMILTLLASFAQEESRSVSENMKWRIKKDFEQGIIWGGNSCLGYKLINKQLHKIDEEAKTVQMIFELYLDGYSDNEICTILNDKGIKPYKSKAWHRTSVMKILTNYNYTGDLLLQKTYRDNHLNKLQKINDGVFNQYVVSDNHEPIVSKEIFNKAQTIRQSKTENHQFSNKKEHDFKGMIKCGLCHKAYTVKHSKYDPVWMCSTFRTKGKAICPSKQVPTKKIIEGFNQIFNLESFDERFFRSKIKQIKVMPNDELIFHMFDGKETSYTWQTSRRDAWTDKMREKARTKALSRYQGGIQHD